MFLFGFSKAVVYAEIQNESGTDPNKFYQLIDSAADTLSFCSSTAKQYILQAGKLAKDSDKPEQLRYLQLALSKYYAYKEKYDSALYHRQQFFDLHAEIYRSSRDELIDYYSDLYRDSVDYFRKELLQTETNINTTRAQISTIILVVSISGILVITLTIALLVFQRRNMKRINGKLKSINKTIVEQRKKIITQNEKLIKLNERIKAHSNVISAHKDSIANKNALLSKIFKISDEQNKTLRQNLSFANQIQTSLLPSIELLKNTFDDFFLIHKPREPVGGDFYWFGNSAEYIFVILADCTGHGVPGAFISIYGKTLLDKIIIDAKCNDPAEILSLMHRETINVFKTSDKNEDFYDFDKLPDDGMDVAICRFSKNFEQLVFAGAGRPVYIFAENKLTEIKGDKHSIGSATRSNKKEKKIEYSNHYVDLQKTCSCYLFSDGYTNQMSQNRQKIGSRKLKQLLSDNFNLPFNEQKAIFENHIIEHMGSQDQTDDVSLIGLKFTSKIN